MKSSKPWVWGSRSAGYPISYPTNAAKNRKPQTNTRIERELADKLALWVDHADALIGDQERGSLSGAGAVDGRSISVGQRLGWIA
jgi:hypothetical protein